MGIFADDVAVTIIESGTLSWDGQKATGWNAPPPVVFS